MTLVVVVVLQSMFLRLLLGPLERRELLVLSDRLGLVVGTFTRDGIVEVRLLVLLVVIPLPQAYFLGWISMRSDPKKYASNVVLDDLRRPHASKIEVAVAVINPFPERII